MKKLCAFLIAVTVVLSMSVTALADPDGPIHFPPPLVGLSICISCNCEPFSDY